MPTSEWTLTTIVLLSKSLLPTRQMFLGPAALMSSPYNIRSSSEAAQKTSRYLSALSLSTIAIRCPSALRLLYPAFPLHRSAISAVDTDPVDALELKSLVNQTTLIPRLHSSPDSTYITQP